MLGFTLWLSQSRVTRVAAVALLFALGAVSSAGAQARNEAVLTAYVVSPGRIGAVVAGVVGLVGAFIGARALSGYRNRGGTGNRPRASIMALILGSIGVILGGIVVATADGGLGTGNGLGGAVVAMIAGLIGSVAGAIGLARSRRIARSLNEAPR